MRVALLLSGQFREGLECYPYIKSRILDVYSPDVFISCWNPSDHINSTVQADTSNLSDSLSVGDIISMYKPKLMLSEDFDSDSITRILERSNLYDEYSPMNGEMNPQSVFCMWYKIDSSYSLMEKYESSVGKKYDYVIKGRFDIKIHNDLFFDPDKSVINIPHGFDWRGGINDVIAYGGRNPMSHYCGLYRSIENYLSRDSVFFHPETLLRNHLLISGYKIIRSDLQVSLRGNMLSHKEVNRSNNMKKSSGYIQSRGNFWDT
jgi:hypothetical protein